MDEAQKLAVLIESNKLVREEVIDRIKSFGIQKIMECKSPCAEHHEVMASNKSGLLVISNNHKAASGLGLVKFCRARLLNWTILVLDHLNSDESAAEAFAAGADDVLHIPFSGQEFNARLKLRMQQTDYLKHEESLANKNTLAKAKLTQTEFEIMNFLITACGKIVTRNQLSQHMENHDWVYGDRKYDVHITNIRKKLKDNLISKYMVITARSAGYYIQETSVND